MKILVLFISLFSLAACVVTSPNNYVQSAKKFEDKYRHQLGQGEEITESWYHYVGTKTTEGDYIMRIFFPESKQLTSELHYADANFSAKDGPAKRWHENGNLKLVGQHKNNLAEGEWKFYHRSNGGLSSTGEYRGDQKQGPWKQYDKKGRLIEELNYKNNFKHGGFVQYDTLGEIINRGTYARDTIYEQTKVIENFAPMEGRAEHMPYLYQCRRIKDLAERKECSNSALLKYIYKNLHYPRRARDYGIEGMTVTQFVVTKTGEIKDVDVVIGICQDMKDECIRVISNLPPWEPGVQDGKKVDVRYTLPIVFKLQ